MEPSQAHVVALINGSRSFFAVTSIAFNITIPAIGTFIKPKFSLKVQKFLASQYLPCVVKRLRAEQHSRVPTIPRSYREVHHRYKTSTVEISSRQITRQVEMRHQTKTTVVQTRRSAVVSRQRWVITKSACVGVFAEECEPHTTRKASAIRCHVIDATALNCRSSAAPKLSNFRCVEGGKLV
jgi:hypothetical protein